ncbi:MAG: LON peptidase substrate-binding domain-containing protein, partial [Bacteroidales bacterium]|nr:LON peptidase substrate-binding domain-containing protein [Bacteroidales bacterium]
MKKEFNSELLLPNGAEVSIIPVMQGMEMAKVETSELPEVLPILALRNAVIFPGMVYPVTIGREKSIRLIRDAERLDSYIGAVPQKDLSVEDPGGEDLFEYGTVCRIMKVLDMPDGTATAILQGAVRLRMGDVISTEPYITAKVTYEEDIVPEDDVNTKMISEALKEKASSIIRSSAFAPKEAVGALKSIEGFPFLVNFVATTIEVENFGDKVDLLRYAELKTRAMKLLSVLEIQTQLLRIKQEINQKVKSEIDQQQREYFLNNQLKTIQEELGMDEEEEFEKLRAKARTKKWPEAVGKQFEKELSKLMKYNPSSPDYSIQYNYIEFMLDLPWGEISKDNLDLKHAVKVLDDDHYGLEKVKERIIEYLAVLKLKGNMKSPILCLYGPPGVGKTSLGKSIARALGRKYVRVALGGMHDEAELRGHRKTYVGALP